MAERIARVDRARPPFAGGSRADSECRAACKIEPQATACDVCGGTERVALFSARDYEHGVPGEWLVARCVRCNFASLSPMPPDEDVASFYPESYSAYQGKSALSWMFRAVYRLDARRIRRLVGDRGRILDVGCGSGEALLQIRRYGDWELCGVELNGGAAAKARAAGLSVQQGDLSSCDFPEASMRLIRMGHVIEHVPRPSTVLRRAYALLAPGGVLYGETPSTECLDFRLFGKYWGALHVPRHLCFFDRSNLRRALERAGFVDIAIRPRLRTVGWSCGVQNYLADRAGLVVPDSGRVPWYLLLILCFLPLTLLQALSGRTATVAFTARRPENIGRR
jgi:SAM-dependent methyltransferase